MTCVNKEKRNIILIIIACLLGAAAIVGGWLLFRYNTNVYYLPVTLEGEREIFLEYGTEFEDPGATAVFYGTKLHTQPVAVEVSAFGKVDVDTVGDYLLTYRATVEGQVGTAYRLVHVVDTVAPVITLTTLEDHYTIPGEPYREEGYAAFDAYDGVLTDQVQREEKDGVVIYRVADSSGNVGEVTRTIKYMDPVAPKITLNGRKSITIFQSVPFKEPGAVAEDNLDGDLTDAIVYEGRVDHNTVGSYELTYTVVDSSGNRSTAKRMVTVIPVPAVEAPEEGTAPEENIEITPVDLPDYIEPNGMNIYLTFDDGPGAHTDRLLDILKKYNVKATFFVVSTRYIDKITRASQEGHTIAIHSATHDFHKIYASEESYFSDFYYLYNKILELTGKAPEMMRFPGGSSNTISRFNKGIMSRLRPQLKELGFRVFDWNVDSNDAGGARTADEVFENVIRGVQKHYYSVVLQHDIHGFSVDAVERIIQWGLANGYTFTALTVNSPTCEHGIRN